MNNEMMSAADMITRIFTNIDKAQVEKSNSLFSAWKETVLKINEYGEKLSVHTKVIDLKNGVLLVETDHPGWSQILQLNENFIIRGLNWKVPKLGIKNLMIRLEGSDAFFAGADYDALVKENQREMENKSIENKEKLQKLNLGVKNPDAENDASETQKNKLPKELLEKFEFIKKNMDEMR